MNRKWAMVGSNHRRRKPADLQSAPFGRSGNRPELREEEDSGPRQRPQGGCGELEAWTDAVRGHGATRPGAGVGTLSPPASHYGPCVTDAAPPAEPDPRLIEHLRRLERYEDHDANGVDRSLIRANLAMTPLERVRQGDRHLEEYFRLRGLVRRVD